MSNTLTSAVLAQSGWLKKDDQTCSDHLSRIFGAISW